MYFDLDDEQQAFVATVENFAAKEIGPGAIERDRAGEWYVEGWRKMGQLGLLGLQFPEEYGGSGASVLTTAAAFQAFTSGGADAGIALSWVAHSVLAGTPLWLFGTDDQKRRYLAKIASGEWTAGYGLTEPNAGSDAASLQTVAVRRGDRWILNGSKMFITNAPAGDVFVVFASEDRALGSRGVTAFIVERGFPGFSSGRELDKMGNRTSPTGELIFSNCEVPVENVLGEPRKGFAIAKAALEWERFLMMAHSIGTMRATLRDCSRYAGERRQFGKPILDQPAIRAKLADMRLNIAAGELFVRRVAWLKDQQLPTPLESSSCKLFCSGAVMQTTMQGVQVLGGYGYIRENAVERNMRDAKLAEIGGGTTEIQRQVVGRAILKEPDQRWDRAYTPGQVAARCGPPGEAPDLTGACLALAEQAQLSVGPALVAMAHEAVRWTLRLSGQAGLLMRPPEVRVTADVIAGAEVLPLSHSPSAQDRERVGVREPVDRPLPEACEEGPRLATYWLAGDLVLNAPRADLLLHNGRLLSRAADWTSEAPAAIQIAVPEAPLARVSLHGEGQPVNAGSLESIARVFCAAIATGIAEAALEEALDAARGKPDDQLVDFKLADMRTRLDGCRMLTHKAATLLDRRDNAVQAAREARIFAAEAAVFCTDQAVAIAGAFRTPRLQTLQRDCHAPGALDFPLTQERLALALQG
jgi:butyryl-CoA dehydrogenase